MKSRQILEDQLKLKKEVSKEINKPKSNRPMSANVNLNKYNSTNHIRILNDHHI